MALKLNSSGGGSVTLDAPVTANNYTLTAPASSGTLATTDGGNTTFTSITDSGNLTFTGTGNRITGDMSNATLTNRLMFQNSVTNGSSNVQVLPNGTATVAGFLAFNNSDPTNSSWIQLAAGISSDSRITSGISGTGTYLPMTFYTSGSERMRIDTSGNVGIGTSSPAARLHLTGAVASTTRPAVYLENTTASTGRTWYISANDGGPLGFVDVTANLERMRIDSSGRVQIGNTTGTDTFNVFGTAYISGATYINDVVTNTTANAANGYYNTTNGRCFRSTSSLKYKTDVKDAPWGLNEVLKLRPVTYKSKSETDGDKVFGGLIAEEVDAAGLTEFVQYADDGTPDALAYGHMVSLCIKAIQEQQEQINALKAEVAKLKGA